MFMREYTDMYIKRIVEIVFPLSALCKYLYAIQKALKYQFQTVLSGKCSEDNKSKTESSSRHGRLDCRKFTVFDNVFNFR